MFQTTLKVFEKIKIDDFIDERMKNLGLVITEKARRKGQTYTKGGQFWNRVCQSIGFTYSTKAKTLTYGANHVAAAHKQYGGVISAPGKGEGSRRSKYLTIPISPISKGKNTSVFRKVSIKTFFFTSKKGNLILAMTSSTKKKMEPLFLLKKSVYQKAQPYFPDGAELDTVVTKHLGGVPQK
jgi:hypothetical protein